MPNPNSDDYLAAMLKGYGQRLANLENQQTFIVSDPQGVQRVRLGLQTNGDLGLLVADINGNPTEILPLYWNEVAALESTTSATYTDLATPGPSVTAIIGANGTVMVTISTYVGVDGIAGSQAGGRVSLSIDGGAAVGDYLYYSISSAAGDGIAGNQATTVVLGGLAPGSHTFEMKYATFNGGAVHFMTRFLQVRPF